MEAEAHFLLFGPHWRPWQLVSSPLRNIPLNLAGFCEMASRLLFLRLRIRASFSQPSWVLFSSPFHIFVLWMLSDFSKLSPFGSYLKENNRRLFRYTQDWPPSHLTTKFLAPAVWVVSVPWPPVPATPEGWTACLETRGLIGWTTGQERAPGSTLGSPELRTAPATYQAF